MVMRCVAPTVFGLPAPSRLPPRLGLFTDDLYKAWVEAVRCAINIDHYFASGCFSHDAVMGNLFVQSVNNNLITLFKFISCRAFGLHCDPAKFVTHRRFSFVLVFLTLCIDYIILIQEVNRQFWAILVEGLTCARVEYE